MLFSFHLAHWVEIIGYIGILAIIFLETGVFFGFFLPGDSLLFTVGFLASQRIFNIWLLLPIMILTAILGYQIGYWFGKKLSDWLLRRKNSLWFKPKYLEQAKLFYHRYGVRALILGRWIPIVRTFVPIVAGAVSMKQTHYIALNIIGALSWVGGVTVAGFYLGKTVPNAEHYILPIVLGIIVLSLFPTLWQYAYASWTKKKSK